MRVFLTGATGLVGGRLLEALRHRGDEVVALSRSARLDTPSVHWVRGDYRNLERWGDEVDGCDAVVNLAGEPLMGGRWSTKRMEAILHSRVGTTTALYHAIRQASERPRVLISASAVGYYGPHPEASFDEASPPGDGFLARVCREWEAAASRSRELDVRVVCTRLGVVLDGRGGALKRMALPIRYFLGGPIGRGEAWVSWVHHADATGLILFALDHEEVSGPLNVVAPQPVRQEQLAGTMGRILNRPVWLRAPALPLRLGLGRMAEELLLSGQRAVPKEALSLGYGFLFPDLRRALAEELKT